METKRFENLGVLFLVKTVLSIHFYIFAKLA